MTATYDAYGVNQPDARWKEKGLYCPFCGADSAIRSYGDTHDRGRLELYCTNSECDVREMAVIVLRDGHTAWARPDVRALDVVDDGKFVDIPRDFEIKTLAEIIAEDYNSKLDERRQGPLYRAETERHQQYLLAEED